VKLGYVIHGAPMGISYGINHARFLLGDEPFLCYLGDNIFGESLAPYVKRFQENPQESLILLKKLGIKEASRYGVAIFKEKELVQLVEKPRLSPIVGSKLPPWTLGAGDYAYVMLGAYFFTPKFFEIYPSLKPSERGEYEVTDAVNALMPMVSYEIYQGEWFDCGTFDSILEASNYIAKSRGVT
jgi:glucose-1-phosphate thymidylyltransferase